MTQRESLARRLWLCTEPAHAVLYFHPDCRTVGRDLGLKGFWMGYFATRAAPMGPVGPAVVTAAFGVFAPGTAARALPAAWEVVTPHDALAERSRRAAAALRGTLPGIEAYARRTDDALRTVVEEAPWAARPLFAANQALPPPDDPVARLWQWTTALREFRGDAHVAALADAGLDGCEAVVLTAADGRVPADGIRRDRGWSEEEWAAAAERLAARGLLTPDGAISAQGRRERERVEEATDRLASRLLRPLSEARTEALLTDLEPVTRAVLSAGILPFPNPIGMPRP